MAGQSLKGDQGVQISNAWGSTFTINYNNGPARAVPLERATVAAPAGTNSPARLMRARSGVVPFVARTNLRDELISWLDSDVPFSGAVIGGAGGSGKTRLAVEICDHAEGRGWLSGFLTRIGDPPSLEALAEAPVPRLVAIDYAESRTAQMEALLPLLASRATRDAPVRVLLLVRAGPKRTSDWAEAMRNQSDTLDNLLDECAVHVLDELSLAPQERLELFTAAAAAFADRLGVDTPGAPVELADSPAFAGPLLIVLAAYLATQGTDAPATREELLRAVVAHEERYWRSSSANIFADQDQARRVIALTTLVAAGSESEAIDRLRLLPDLADAPAERLGLIARWARKQYPGSGWWNPLEPDLIGEQLVADEFFELHEALAAALDMTDVADLIRPLEVLGRAAADHPSLGATLQPNLEEKLKGLCEIAVVQARDEADQELLSGRVLSLAAVLEKAVAAVELDRQHLSSALAVIPLRFDLVLGSLALTMTEARVEHDRRLVAGDPATFEPHLAGSLNNLSNRLSEAGQREDALATIEASLEIRRRLAAADPARFEPGLAQSLNNLGSRLAGVGRREEALLAIEEAVEIDRRLAAGGATTSEPRLAGSLNNLSICLFEAGRREDSLTPIEESVKIRRRLAAADQATFEPDLAASLSNLSNRLADAMHPEMAIVPIEESVAIRRRLAAANPAAFEPGLAQSLNNLANRLAEIDRQEEAIARAEESVEIRRRLAAASPPAFEPHLASSLNNFSNHLSRLGRSEAALELIEEAVEIRRRLAARNPLAFEHHLARSLNNSSNHLARLGHSEAALEPIEDAVEIRRRLAARNPDAFEPDLAKSLNNLASRLSGAGRYEEAVPPIEEAVEIRRRLAARNPDAFEPELAKSLNNLSNHLADVERSEEALKRIEEAVEIGRRVVGANPSAPIPLALFTRNLARRSSELGPG